MSAEITRKDNARHSRSSRLPRWRPIPVHPVLVAAFPVLALYAHNLGQVSPEDLWGPLGASVGGALAAWGIAALLARSIRKGAFAASAITLTFHSYGHIANLLAPTLRVIAVPACALLILAVLVAIMLSRGGLGRGTSSANLASFVLLLPSILSIAIAGLHSQAIAAGAAGRSWAGAHAVRPAAWRGAPIEESRHLTGAQMAKLPDIYYIILDAYARQDSLQTFYGFDNSPFIQELRKRGFYVAGGTRANYDQTTLCIASALNMDYLDELARSVGRESGGLDAARQMVGNNRVAAYLRRHGYRYVCVSSEADDMRTDKADLKIGASDGPSTFDVGVIGLSAVSVQEQERRRAYDRYRAKVLAPLAGIDIAARLPYRKFVFAHVMSPHPPFVLGVDGRPVYPAGPLTCSDGSWLLRNITKDQYRAGYIAQLQYVNQRALAAIDTILRSSPRRPLIIVQGDHGSRMNIDWDSKAKTDLREPFSPLNAYCVPPDVRSRLYPDISPVNSFRIVLSSLFGARLPLLPDRSFYSTAGRPLDFEEVTGLIPPMNCTRAADADNAPIRHPKAGSPGSWARSGASRT